MRAYGALSPTDAIPFPADTVQTLFMTGGSSAQALDWFASSGAAPNAGSAGVQIVRISAFTTAGVPYAVNVNLNSTAANVPSSGSSVTTGTTQGSSGNCYPIVGGGNLFQIPGYSTGWSAAALTSGYVMVESWRK